MPAGHRLGVKYTPNTPPQAQEWWSEGWALTILSLERRTQNWEGERALVRISAYWSIAGTWTTLRSLLSTLSRTKNRSNSMCLVRVWRTGLWERATVLRLSQKIVGVEWVMWSSNNKVWIQTTSTVTWARLRYSASVLDRATTVCFLAHQETRLGPRNTAAPEVDLLSSGSEA